MIFNRTPNTPKVSKEDLKKAEKSFQSWIHLLSDRDDIIIPQQILEKYTRAHISEKLQIILDFLETQGIEWVDEDPKEEKKTPPKEDTKGSMLYQAEQIKSECISLAHALKIDIEYPETFQSVIGQITYFENLLQNLKEENDRRNRLLD